MRTGTFVQPSPVLRVGLQSALLLIAFTASPKTSLSKPLLTLQGRLILTQGTQPVLHTSRKDYRLSGREPYLLHTLQDKRLVGRELWLEGIEGPNGTFSVEKLRTVRNGKLFRVRYYCEVCNIEALEPGKCVCCQQPTELQETLADENQEMGRHSDLSLRRPTD